MGKDFEITFTVDGKTIAGDRILKKRAASYEETARRFCSRLKVP